MLENFRPGTMEKWGLGPEDVHARNPRCIYARVSGYGQTGRYSHRPGFASAGEAISGLRYINGYPDQAPPRVGISLGDTLAAQSAFQGILLALLRARTRRRGPGRRREHRRRLLRDVRVGHARVREDRLRARADRAAAAAHRAAATSTAPKDGKWVVIAANHDTLWRRLATIMGKPELGEDERFATHHARGEHEDLLDEIIGEFAAGTRPPSSTRIVNEGGVVCAPVYTAQDVYEDPHFRERELLVEIEDEVHGRVTVPGVVPKLSRTPGSIRQAARWTVGADTDAVLEELGVDAQERSAWRTTA